MSASAETINPEGKTGGHPIQLLPLPLTNADAMKWDG